MEMTIGSIIKRLRMASGITQEQLSDAMNVSCAAVSKWERGETYPDITLLQPLAFFFDVTLDELLGYNTKKIQTKIDEIIEYYNKNMNVKERQSIISKAYHDYPNDYRIMHLYMLNISNFSLDENRTDITSQKEEILKICKKILEGCKDEKIRLDAWDMISQILHSEGKTEEALNIYKEKFPNLFFTGQHLSEHLFCEGTQEYYLYVQKNMYELIDFAADKLGIIVCNNKSLPIEEKVALSLKYTDIMLKAFEETEEVFFLLIAKSFLERIKRYIDSFNNTYSHLSVISDKYTYIQKNLKEFNIEYPAFNHFNKFVLYND